MTDCTKCKYFVACDLGKQAFYKMTDTPCREFKSAEEIIEFTIPLPPISKKNSQQIFVNPQTHKPFIMPSKKYKEYEAAALWYIPKGKTINCPVNVKCLFYMPTKRKCDLVNMQEAILDIMTKAGLLEDDNFTIVQSMDGSRVLYDKENARTEVYIEQRTV